MAGQWPLVGRDEELAVVQAAVDGPDGGGIVLVGPQGVGRTRLAREAQRKLILAGRPAVWIGASRAAATVPFGALAHVLPASLASLAASQPVEVLRRVDEVVAAAGPAMVVDDAHLLDDASAALVHQVALRGLATLVVTVRTDGSPPDAVTALWKDELLARCDLGPLSRAAIGGLLERVLDGHLDLLSLRRIQLAAAGNPLFLREIVHAALDRGSLARHRGRWEWDGVLSVSDRLAELVHTRLGTEDPACMPLLEVAAWGDPLPEWLARRLAGSTAIDAAERAGLVVRSDADGDRAGDGDGRGHGGEVLRLGHPVHGAVLRATMPMSRRREICERLALATSARLDGDGPELVRIAEWLVEAATPADRRPVSLAAASRRALHDDRPRLAERLARAALDDEPTEALAALAEALEKQGRHEERHRLPHPHPTPASTEAGDHPATDPQLGVRATAVRGPSDAQTTSEVRGRGTDEGDGEGASDVPGWGSGASPGDGAGPGDDGGGWEAEGPGGFGVGVGAAASGARVVGGDPAADRSRGEVPATDAWVLLFDSRLADSIGVAQVVLARTDVTARAQVWAATAGTAALGLSGRTAEALAAADTGSGAARLLGSSMPWSEPETVWTRVLALAVAGRVEEARALVEQVGEPHDAPPLAGMWRGMRGFVAKMQGDHATASPDLRIAATQLDRADMEHFVRFWLAELAATLAGTGEARAARRVFDEAVDRDTGRNRVFEPWVALDGAWVCAGEGRLAEAVDVALRAADMAVALGQRALEVAAAYDVARLGRPELVEDRLAALVPLVEGRFAPTCRDATRALRRDDGRGLTDCSRRFEALGHDLMAAEMAVAALEARPDDPGAAERVRRLRARCPHAITPLLGRHEKASLVAIVDEPGRDQE